MSYSTLLARGSCLLTLLLLAACSDGNGNNNAAAPNQVPVADAGADALADEGTTVVLDGSGSADPDGAIAAYQWSQTSGTDVALTGADTASASFTAPAAAAAGILVFQLTVTDDDGATDTDSVTITVVAVAPPNQPPVADAGTDQFVDEGVVVTLDGGGSADPDDGIAGYQWNQTGGPVVVLAGADTAVATFTAPSGGGGPLVFELSVVDASGARATDETVVTVNRLPIANAGVDQIAIETTTVVLDGSGSSDPDGDVSGFAWSQTAGPVVALTDADTAAPSFTVPDVDAPTELVFELVVTDDEGADSVPASVTITAVDTPATVTVRGQITFASVPHAAGSPGLDYAATALRPVRGALVQALDGADDSPIAGAETTTDENGNYALAVPSNSTVRIRANAWLLKTDAAPTWDFRVVDNGGVVGENPKPLYALDSDTFESGIQEWIVNLSAESGWDGAAYSSARAAAPFAILDAVYDSVLLTLSEGDSFDFPQLLLNWSPLNTTDPDASIGTSFYDPNSLGVTPSGQQIFILGEEDVDTDEYDRHVVAHEWLHYFEDRVTRTDSIGGGHSPSDLLDLRVAFSEAWGNGFAAIVVGDPFYRDAEGVAQGSGFWFDMEDGSGACVGAPVGWYAECSIGEILYDLYDDVDDGADQVTLGFGPVFDVLVGAQTTTPALTSIYTFASYLRDQNPAEVAAINALLQNANISDGNGGIDLYGDLETNDGAADGVTETGDVLPIYTPIQVDGTPVTNLCSNVDQGDFNKLSTHRFLRFTVAVDDAYLIRVDATATRPAGAAVDPDFAVYDENGLLTFAVKAPDEFEEKVILLGAGDYVLVIWDDNNVGILLDEANRTLGRYCQDVTIAPAP